MLQRLQLIQPTTIAEASAALADLGEGAKIYAGGAELLLLLRNGLLETETLVDVKKIDRLHRITMDTNAIRVGACVSHQELASHPLIRQHAPALAYAESHLANVRVRNQGTLGGNLAFNDPHSDPGTVLLVHDAAVVLGSSQGERKLPLADFFVDMYATALQPSELLVEVEVPFLPSGMKSGYQRLHRYQRPTLGVAAAVRMNSGAVEEARLAVGCVGPKSLRLTDLEAKIKGATIDGAKSIISEEKSKLRELIRPVDDLLGSADYKLYMTTVMLGDVLGEAVEKALS
ncbi:MAG: xanthine dehydrogenase family protein subunit M [Deltaproteobacteria bacterium]|nr:xanthine dehydrogenase family protein subunit M [Deltaproteobacteria bacterium]